MKPCLSPLLVLIGLNLSACSTPPRRIESGTRIDMARWGDLEAGKTTEVEATAWFGEPADTVAHADGRTHWVYVWGRAQVDDDDKATEIVVETFSLIFRDGILEHTHRGDEANAER